MIHLAFYKAPGNLFDKAIRTVTGSKYSHCELVIDGVCYSSSPRDRGVRAKQIYLDSEQWDILDIEAGRSYAINWFIHNVGSQYDWPGAITSVLPININLPNRFFCSEACAHMLGINNPKKITPGGLYKMYKK